MATSIPAIPFAANLLLWIISGLATLAAMRPSRATIYYASDALGVYFPERKKLGDCWPGRAADMATRSLAEWQDTRCAQAPLV